ncbi:MAG TPA: TolC family protein [Victivallales bacterium]|nr:TolC family protein [Victivallales bacterium]
MFKFNTILLLDKKHINIFLCLFFLILFTNCSTPGESEALKKAKEIKATFYTEEKEEDEDKPSNPPPKLNKDTALKNYVFFALKNNPALESAFYKWKAALEVIPQVKAMPDPNFRYGYYIQALHTLEGPLENYFSLSQTFPWYGTLALQGSAAFRIAEAERQNFEAEVLNVIYSVKKAYYNYWYLGKSIEIVTRNLKYLNDTVRFSKTRYETTVYPYTNILKLEIEDELYKNSLETLKEFIPPIRAQFNYALGRNTTDKIPFPKEVELPEQNYTQSELIDLVIRRNPELKSLGFLADAENDKIGIALRRYIPDLTVGVDLTTIHNAAQFNQDPLIITVGMNLPIYFTKYNAERREAKANKQKYLRSKEDKQNLLLSNLHSAIYNEKDAWGKMMLYKDSLIPKATKALELTRESFDTGQSDYNTFIDAYRELLDFELKYALYIMNYSIAIAKIAELIGPEDIEMKREVASR